MFIGKWNSVNGHLLIGIRYGLAKVIPLLLDLVLYFMQIKICKMISDLDRVKFGLCQTIKNDSLYFHVS